MQKKFLAIPTFPPVRAGSSALVVFSGGQDSVTCLGWALRCYERVEVVSFDYNQKHKIELQQASDIAYKVGVRHHILNMKSLAQMGDSALIAGSDHTDVSCEHHHKKGLPASFVPARNALFLTAAHGLAQKLGFERIITGVSSADYSGYPDCRGEFIEALETALNIGYETDIRIEAPLLHLNKAETFALAQEANVLDIVLRDSHTCYNGNRDAHDWGKGCGQCPACKLRAKGWEEYLECINS